MLVWVGIVWIVAAVIVVAAVLSLRNRMARLIEQEIQPAVQEIRGAVRRIDELIGEVRKSVGRVDRITAIAETVASGTALASAAGKVVAGSKVTLVSLLAGLKEGLSTLRKSTESKEVADDG